jgi:hypothetical protein
MREKEERDALPRARGAVRLTEFDPPRKDGFVNRMNKETTSFFFTNFPAKAQVMELWTLFAKHGRIGEVYVPNKLDKRGNRFGFAKFKDVKSVEALSDRLQDLWLGSYKLQVNLARFGRGKESGVQTQAKRDNIPVNRATAPILEPAWTRPKVLFKNALTGDSSGLLPQPSIEADVDQDFLQVLAGSYVGVMAAGVEVRAVQMKLWLAGLLSIRAVTMGGRLILLYRSSGEDVGDPVRRKDWWGGLLSDIKIWTPNLVAAKKECWVNIYGVPLHSWCESTFRSIVNGCGVLLALDDGTSKKLRFDVARVKVETDIGGRLDFACCLQVQGAGYRIRVVEEVGGLVGEEVYVEDQLRRSEVGSSCASGGHGSVRAAIEGFDGVDSDSDASEGCQHHPVKLLQLARQSTDANQQLGKETVGAEEGTESVMDIHRKINQEKVTVERRVLDTRANVRGFESSANCVRRQQGGVGPVSVVSAPLVQPSVLVGDVGLEGLVSGVGSDPIMEEDCALLDSGLRAPKPNTLDSVLPLEPSPPIPSNFNEAGKSLGGAIIEKFDLLLNKSRGKNVRRVSSSLSEEDQNISSSPPLSMPDFNPSISTLEMPKRVRRSQPPIQSLLGPKCLRLAGIIQNGCLAVSRRRVSEVSSPSRRSADDVESNCSVRQANTEVVQNSQGLDLEVVLPFATGTTSGVHHLMGEDSLGDLEGFVAARDNPMVQEKEVEVLLKEQKDLGMIFDQRTDNPVSRMVTMEVRDRGQVQVVQEQMVSNDN